MALKELLTNLTNFKYTDYDSVGVNTSKKGDRPKSDDKSGINLSKISGRHGGYKGKGQPPHPEEHSKFDDGAGQNLSKIKGRHGGFEGGGEPPHPEEHSKFDDKVGRFRKPQVTPNGSFLIKGIRHIDPNVGGIHGGIAGPTPAQPPHPDDHSIHDDGVGYGVYPSDHPQSFTIRGYQVTGNKRFYIGWQGDFMNHPPSDYGIGAFNRIAGVFDHTQTRDKLRKVYSNYPEITFGADIDGGINGLNGSIHIGNQDLPEVVGGGLSYYGNLNSITPRSSIYRAGDGTYRVPQSGHTTIPPGVTTQYPSNIPTFDGTQITHNIPQIVLTGPFGDEDYQNVLNITPKSADAHGSDFMTTPLANYVSDFHPTYPTTVHISGFNRDNMYIPGIDEPSTPVFNQFTRSDIPLIRIDRYSDNFDPDGDDVFDFPTTSTIPYNIPYHKPGEEHLQPFVIRDVGDVWGYSDTDLFTADPLGKAAGFINDIAGEFLRAPPDVLMDRTKADVTRISKFLESPKGTLFIAEQFILQAFNPTLETKVWNPLSLGSIVPLIHIKRHAPIAIYGDKYTDALTLLDDSRIKFQSPLATVLGSKVPVDKRLLAVNPNKYTWPIAGGLAAAVKDSKKIEGSQSKVTGRAKKQSDGGIKDLFQKLSFNKYDSGNNVYLTKDGIMGTPEPDSPFGIIASLPLTVSEAQNQVTNALTDWASKKVADLTGKKKSPEVEPSNPPPHRFDLLEQTNKSIPISGPLLNSPLAAIMASYYPGMQGSYSFPTHILGDLWPVFGHDYQYPVTKGDTPLISGTKLDGAWGVSLARYATGDANVHEGEISWKISGDTPIQPKLTESFPPLAQTIVLGDNQEENWYEPDFKYFAKHNSLQGDGDADVSDFGYGISTEKTVNIDTGTGYPEGQTRHTFAIPGSSTGKKIYITTPIDTPDGRTFGGITRGDRIIKTGVFTGNVYDPDKTFTYNEYFPNHDSLITTEKNLTLSIEKGVHLGPDHFLTKEKYPQARPTQFYKISGDTVEPGVVKPFATDTVGTAWGGITKGSRIIDKVSFAGDRWNEKAPYELSAGRLKMIESKPSVVNKRIYINTYGDEHDKTAVALGELYSLNIDETISELQKNGQWLKMNWGFLSDKDKKIGAGGVEPFAQGYSDHFNTIYPFDTARLGLVASNGLTIGASRRKIGDNFKEVAYFDDGVPGALQHKLYYHAFAKPVVPVEKGDVLPTSNIPAVIHTLAHIDKDYSTKYGGRIVGAGIQGVSYFDGDLFGPYRGKPTGEERYDKITRTGDNKIIQLGAASPVSIKKNYIHIGSDSGTQTPLTTKKIEYKPVDESYTPQSSTENQLRDTDIFIGDQFGDYTQESTLQKYFKDTTTLVGEGVYKNIGFTINKTATDFFKKDTLSAKSKIVVTHKHSKIGDKQYAIDLTKNRIVKTDATVGGYSGDVYGESKKYGDKVGQFEQAQDDTPHLYKKTRLKINENGEPELTFNIAYNTNITRTNTYKSLISTGGSGPLIDKTVNLREFKDYSWSTQFLIGPNKARGVTSVGNIYGPSGKNRYGFVEYSANKKYADWVAVLPNGSSLRQDQNTEQWYYMDENIPGGPGRTGRIYPVRIAAYGDNGYSVIEKLPSGANREAFVTNIIPMRAEPKKVGPGGGQIGSKEVISKGSGDSNLDVVTVADPKDPTGVSDIPIAHKNLSSENKTSNVDTDPDGPRSNKPKTSTVPAEATLHLHTTSEQSKNADIPPTPEGTSAGKIHKYKSHKYGDIGKDNLRYGKAYISPGELRIDVNPDDLTDPEAKAKGVLPEYSKLVNKRQKLANVVYQLGNPGQPKVLSVSDTGDDPIGGPIKPGSVDGNNKPTSYIGAGTDRVNMIPYHGEETAYPDGIEDFIKFKIRDVINKKWIIFRATLSGISEQFAPEWSSEKYIGRPDSVHVYQGVERSLSFNFIIYPNTRQELPILWEKLNYLVGLTYPTWRTANPAGGKRMEAPFVHITIGDMYNEVPGFFSSIGVEIDDNSTWELDKNLQLPKAISVSCEFTHIGKHPLASQGKHYDLNWLQPYDQKEARLGDRPDAWVSFYDKIGQVGVNSNTQNPQAVVAGAEAGG